MIMMIARFLIDRLPESTGILQFDEGQIGESTLAEAERLGAVRPRLIASRPLDSVTLVR